MYSLLICGDFYQFSCLRDNVDVLVLTFNCLNVLTIINNTWISVSIHVCYIFKGVKNV